MTSLLHLAWRALVKLGSIIVSAFVLGLSLLPLSVLLLAFPTIEPEESVIHDTVVPTRSWLRRTGRRIFAVFTSLAVFIAILAASVELTTQLDLSAKGQFGYVAKAMLGLSLDVFVPPDKLAEMTPDWQQFLKSPIWALLPPAMIEHWPHVILFVYLIDLLLLFAVGKVPLQYNYRNLVVRWRVTALTALAFVVVVGLMVGMLAFVNGMNNLTENTGVPGNVLILSEGATDEIFSNLGYGELDNVEKVVATVDQYNRPLPKPIGIKKEKIGDRDVYWASRETFYILNQPQRDREGNETGRRRFVQLRTMEDGEIGGKVHGVSLDGEGRWFTRNPYTLPNGTAAIECVLGHGIAGTLGAEAGKAILAPGDVFDLGNENWIVVGVMKQQASTFGSEIWTARQSKIYEPFGKRSYTTFVVRNDTGTDEGARILAHKLSTDYPQQKLKAVSEQAYYAELNKTNRQFLIAFSFVALVMSIGSVFGVMNTMFAAIASRIRDIGVLRLLGFKRWQILVSFMLESLLIAILGGVLGCCVGFFIDGRSANGTLSGSSGPGGKSIVISIDVSSEIIVCGLLFTLVIGRLGGLVPALSAIRMKMLDSLK